MKSFFIQIILKRFGQLGTQANHFFKKIKLNDGDLKIDEYIYHRIMKNMKIKNIFQKWGWLR